MRSRDSESPCHSLLIQTKDFAGRRCGTEYDDSTGDMPTHIVMIWHYGKPNPAFNFDADHEGVNGVGATDAFPFSKGKQCGPDRCAGMDRLDMRIVEIEHMRADSIQ